MNIHDKFDQKKPVQQVSKVESITCNKLKDKSLKQFFRKNSIFFENDLSDKEKETLIKRMVSIFTAILDEDLVTVNSVARMLGLGHTQVGAFCKENSSLSAFINGWTNLTKVNKVFHQLNYLSKEELSLLKKKLDEQEQSLV